MIHWFMLKLNLFDKTTQIRILYETSETSMLYLNPSRFNPSECGSSLIKTYYANRRTLFEEK